MKRYLLSFFITVSSLGLFAQPDSAYVDIDPADTGLVGLPWPGRRTYIMYESDIPIIVDGVIDPFWDCTYSQDFDRYILCSTKYNAGVYSCEADTGKRTPDNASDFSGIYRIYHDNDYLYLLFDVTDNQVNDSVINPGITEQIDLFMAPYPDSVQQLLQGKPYPLYTGTAPQINKKYAYWAYLGAFQMSFQLVKDGKCNIKFNEKEDAVKINFKQRADSCKCAWKKKDDGKGYIAELAISFKITLADSANNPFLFPGKGEIKFSAFDFNVYDRDSGMKDIVATWNAMDGNIQDAMLYTGKLRFIHNWIECNLEDKSGSLIEKTRFYPNPAADVINLSQKVFKAEIISITGVIMKSELNTEQINISDLPQGLYFIKADNIIIGKLIKQ